MALMSVGRLVKRAAERAGVASQNGLSEDFGERLTPHQVARVRQRLGSNNRTGVFAHLRQIVGSLAES